MSLQFNNRRRRRRSRTRLKREVIITIRVLLAVLVLGLIVYGSINVYSYFNNENKDIMDNLPSESNTDKNPEDDTNSNNGSSDGVPGNDNDKQDEVLDNSDNTEQDKGSGESDSPDESDKSDIDKSDIDKSENNKPDNNENNNVTDNKKPDKNESEKDQDSNSASNDKDNNKNDKKNESYFDDAVFIGDSRTEGLKLYSGLKNATFYAEKGLDVDTIFKHKIKINGDDMTIIDALHKQTFGKVYINLGINEMGWPYDSEFIKHYGKVIDAIKESQPDAEIYLQSIIHITSEKDKNPPDYFKNNTIIRRNKLLKELAKEKEINYIDPNEVLINDKGFLIEGASVDGIHLNKTYCEKWKDFLIDNIVK